MARRPNFLTDSLTRTKGQSGFVDNGIVSVDISLDQAAVQSVFEGPFTVFGRAAAAGVKDAREAAVQRGRANIRAAGFPETWANALQSRQYPKRGNPSKKVEAFINYRFGGVGTVFEFGSTIRPVRAKYLWIPAEGTKKTIFDPTANKGRGGSVPRTAARVGRLSARGLRFVFVDGQPALVAATDKKKKPKVLFWGRKQVYVPKKWDVMPILQSEGEKLPDYVELELIKRLKALGG